MKHFVDIQVIREKDEEVMEGIFKKSNIGAFKVGDLISITEKIDGSNSSICLEDGIIKSFSRTQELDFKNNLDGFFQFAQTLDENVIFSKHTEYVIFGEWLRKNKIKYNPDFIKKWYVYSIWDKNNEKWLERDLVKAFCEECGLTYIHEFYYGPFISWEHCRSFLNSPNYGDRQEGIVIRNLSTINDREIRFPHILKIVNDDFKESMKTRIRVIDPEKMAAKELANELMKSIVTKNRVEKILLKLRDEGIIPDELVPEDMKLISKNLPKRVYEDCVKEEPEIVEAAGEYAGKYCASISMQIAREIILK